MHLDDGAVQGNGLNLDADDLFFLQLGEEAIQDAGLGPAVHPGVDGVPVAKPFRQSPPFTPMFGYEQNCVEYLKIGVIYIAPLSREASLDTTVLCFGDLHAPNLRPQIKNINL